MAVELYIEDELIELIGDEQIATDYAIAEIGNFATRKGFRSINFDVPKTANNKRILENSDIVNNTTVKPYRRLKARVFVNGIDQNIRFADIESVQDNFSLRLYGGNSSFFDLIKKPLHQIDFDYAHTFDIATVVASRTNTNGYIYPIIDYHTDAPNTAIPFTSFDVRYTLPSIFLDTVIEKIVESVGYTLDNKLPTSLPIYNEAKSILPLVNNKYNAFIREEKNDIANTTTNQNLDFISLGNLFIVNFDNQTLKNNTFVNSTETIFFPGIGSETLTKDFYIVNFPSTYGAVAEITVSAINNTSIGRIFFQICRNNAGTNEVLQIYERPVPDTQLLGQDITYNIEFEGFKGRLNDQIYLLVYSTSPAGVFQIKANSKINIYPTEFEYNDYVYLKYLLPETSQAEILKTYSQLYGVLIQSNEFTKTVEIFSYNDIVNNIPNAIDWSNKIDYTEQNKLEFDFGIYGRTNTLKYKDDNQVVTPIGTDGIISVDDETLPFETNLITVLFSPTVMITRVGLLIPQIGIFTTKDGSPPITELKQKANPRILLLDNEDGTIDYTDGTTTTTVTTNLPLSWFIREDKNYNLGFENSLIPQFYGTLQSVLNRTKIVTEKIRLTALDIEALNFLIPVYLDKHNAYFYISKISGFDYGSSESTEVELVKLR